MELGGGNLRSRRQPDGLGLILGGSHPVSAVEDGAVPVLDGVGVDGSGKVAVAQEIVIGEQLGQLPQLQKIGFLGSDHVRPVPVEYARDASLPQPPRVTALFFSRRQEVEGHHSEGQSLHVASLHLLIAHASPGRWNYWSLKIAPFAIFSKSTVPCDRTPEQI